MSNDLALKVVLQAQDQASGVVRGFGSVLSNLPGIAGPVIGGLLAIGAGVIGIGVAAAKMAAEYEQQMNMVQALTGANDKQMAQYDAGIKQLAVDAGVAPDKLAKGLYNVLSAGLSGADAMNVLKLATEDAKIGMTDAGTTTSALTSILKAFSIQSKDYANANAEVLKTVTLGKMTMADYAGAVGKAAVTSAQYHTSLETMNAGLATLTENGVPSAAQAVTDYDQTLIVMDGNIGTVSKSLHKNGIAFDEAKFNTMSYGDKIKEMNKVLQEANDKHVHITGVTKQAAQAIQIISQHSQDYTNNLGQLSNKTGLLMAVSSAWDKTQSGLNQTMSRLLATLDVVMISIGQKLLPVITRLTAQMIPVLANVGKWIVQSGFLDKTVDILTKSITFVIGVITTLITTGVALVNFFKNNQLAADILIAVLAGLAAGALAFAITAIPALVVGFIAWAAAATAAAIATLVAAAPFILIGVIIAAVVLGIILAVQHWGAITAWLSEVWGSFTGWFMGILGDIASFFVGVWNGITSFLQAAWNKLVSIAKIGALVLLAVIFAPIIAIVALFLWLYNHNYYFKDLVDAIVSVVRGGVAWLQGAWTNVINFLVTLWGTISGVARTAWTAVSTAVMGVVNKIVGWLTTEWNLSMRGFQIIWNKLAGLAKIAWDAVVRVFQAVWGRVSGPLTTIKNGITTFFSNLASEAIAWGTNLISGFINGIKNAAGGVGSAIGGVASNIRHWLGFHSPTKGLPDAMEWGPNFMKMFAQGLQSNIPLINVAMQNVGTTLKTGTTPSSSTLGTQGSQAYAGVYTPTTGRASSASSANGGNVYNIALTINAGKANAQELYTTIVKKLTKDLQRGGNLATITSGGKA